MQIAHASARPLPVARRTNLIVKELPDETLIYDLDSDEAHCLNQTAALVWKNCDGQRTVAELCQMLQEKLSASMPEEIVWLALEQLQKFHLLAEVSEPQVYSVGMSRRELARHIGAAALSLPLILSIVAPTAAAQASGCKNDLCVNDSFCCPSHPSCDGGKCKGGLLGLKIGLIALTAFVRTGFARQLNALDFVSRLTRLSEAPPYMKEIK